MGDVCSDTFQRKMNRLEVSSYKNKTTNTIRYNKNRVLCRPLFGVVGFVIPPFYVITLFSSTPLPLPSYPAFFKPYTKYLGLHNGLALVIFLRGFSAEKTEFYPEGTLTQSTFTNNAVF